MTFNNVVVCWPFFFLFFHLCICINMRLCEAPSSSLPFWSIYSLIAFLMHGARITAHYTHTQTYCNSQFNLFIDNETILMGTPDLKWSYIYFEYNCATFNQSLFHTNSFLCNFSCFFFFFFSFLHFHFPYVFIQFSCSFVRFDIIILGLSTHIKLRTLIIIGIFICDSLSQLRVRFWWWSFYVFFYSYLVSFDEKKKEINNISAHFLMAKIKGTSSTRILVLGSSFKIILTIECCEAKHITHNMRCMINLDQNEFICWTCGWWMFACVRSNGTLQFSNEIELLFVHDSITISLLLLCKLFFFVIFIWMWTWPGLIIRFQFYIFNAPLISTRSLPFHTIYL